MQPYFPHLHFKIGVINVFLENFYGSVEEQVGLISPEEKVARNSIIIAKDSLEHAKDRVEKWHMESNRSYIVASLKSHGLTNDQRKGITAEKENKEREISGLVEHRKNIEKDVMLKRKALAEKRKDFQVIVKREKK